MRHRPNHPRNRDRVPASFLLNGTLHAFITLMKDEALAAAALIDRKMAAGQGGDLPLAGVPTAIKDSFWTKGIRTTGGTKVLAGFVPNEDATA